MSDQTITAIGATQTEKIRATDNQPSNEATTQNEVAAANQDQPSTQAATTQRAEDTVQISDDAKREVPAQAPPGFDQTKWSNPEHRTAKYITGRSLASVRDEWRAIPSEEGQKKFVENHLRGLIPEIEAAHGGKVLDVRNEKILYDHNDGKGPHWVDTVFSIGDSEKSEPQWHVEENYPGEFDEAGASGGAGGASGASGAGAPAPGADPFSSFFNNPFNNPFSPFNPLSIGNNDVMRDPDVQRTIKMIVAAGGQPVHADKNRVLADFGDGQPPRWVPVMRDQERNKQVDAMLNALFGGPVGHGAQGAQQAQAHSYFV